MAIAEIIKFEGPRDALVWKNPGKDYTINGDEKIDMFSQLIVDEFYEAILFMNGNALDLFKPGRHTLKSQNIPLLTESYDKLFNGTPFPCKVYFINKTNRMELKWGTKGGITLNDPIYDVFLHVGCCGTMTVSIEDSRRFLLKFVGNKDVFGDDDLLYQLRGIISANVKNYISKLMIQGEVSFFDMNAHIYDVGKLVQKVLEETFADYGIAINQFDIESIDVPREDYDEISKAKSAGSSRRIQGFSWQEERMYEVLNNAAQNEGSSSDMMGAGMGLGMGVGIGAPMGRAFSEITNNAFSNVSQAPQGGQSGGMASNISSQYHTPVRNQNIDVNNFFKGHGQQAQTQQPMGQQPQQQSGGFCPNCGAAAAPNAAFCCQCGTPLNRKKVCANCGAELGPNALFCSQCGTPAR